MIETSGYIDVEKKLKEIGFNQSNSIIILPKNFEEANSKKKLDLTNADVIGLKLFNMHKIQVDTLSSRRPSSRFSVESEAINIFIPFAQWFLIPIITGIFSAYLYDIAKSKIGVNLIIDSKIVRKINFNEDSTQIKDIEEEKYTKVSLKNIDDLKNFKNEIDNAINSGNLNDIMPSEDKKQFINIIDEIVKAKELLNQGTIDQEEFKKIKDHYLDQL